MRRAVALRPNDALYHNTLNQTKKQLVITAMDGAYLLVIDGSSAARVPLGVALPQMLESIEAELANEKLEPERKSRLRHRAQVIQWLLVPQVFRCHRCIREGSAGVLHPQILSG